MAELNELSRETLEVIFGKSLMAEAEYALDEGKIVQRVKLSDDNIVAVWDTSNDSPRIGIRSHPQGISVLCTCDVSKKRQLCPHTATLALAWVLEPNSFENQDPEDLEESGLFEPSVKYKKDQKWFVTPQPENLIGWLNQFTIAQLREMAHNRGISLSGLRKEPIVQSLAEQLFEPASIQKGYQSLSPDTRQVLFVLTITSSNAFIIKSTLKAALNLISPTIHLDAAINELVAYGFVYDDQRSELRIPPGLALFLPPDEALSKPHPQTDRLRIEPAWAPNQLELSVCRLLLVLQAGPQMYKAAARPALHSLQKENFYLRDWPLDVQALNELGKLKGQLLWKAKIPLKPAAPLLPADVQKTLSEACNISAETLDFLLHLLAVSQTIVLSPNKTIGVNEANAQQYFHHLDANRCKELFDAYLNNGQWNEIEHYSFPASIQWAIQPSLSTYFDYSAYLSRIVIARTYLLLALRRLPAGVWFDVSSFLEKAHAFATSDSFWHSSLSSTFFIHEKNAIKSKKEDFIRIYRALLEPLLKGPLHWMGLVDLGYEKESLSAFRLTEMGAWMFQQPNQFVFPMPAKNQPAIEFAHKNQILLTAENASSELFGLLSQIGKIHGGAKGKIMYMLNAQSASQAFDNGWKLDDILNILQKASAQSLPTDLKDTLSTWWNNYGTLQLYTNVSLMEFTDDYALNELLAGTSLASYLLYRFSPRLIAIRPEGAAFLQEELVKKGYTPRVLA